MMLRRCFASLALMVMITAAQNGWAGEPPASVALPAPVRGFSELAYALADGLEHNLVQFVDRSRPILFTSFVDLDDLNTTSSFGRLLGEQVASRMSQLGYRIVELKMRQGSMIFNHEAGEMALSRDLRDVRTHRDAQAVLVGTYVLIEEAVIVSARLLSTSDGALLASWDATVRKTRDISELAAKNRATFRPENGQVHRTRPDHQAGDEGPLARGAILLDPQTPLAARLIQTRLAELNYYTGRVDGIWGKNSRAALNRFKTERRLGSPAAWDLPAQRELFRGTGQ